MNLFAEIGTHLSGLDRLRTMMKDGHLTGIEETLGLRLVEVEEGRVVVKGSARLAATDGNEKVKRLDGVMVAALQSAPKSSEIPPP